MRFRTFQLLEVPRIFILLALITAALSFLIIGVGAQQPVDSRPRQTATATATPTPTPIPQTGPGRRRRRF